MRLLLGFSLVLVLGAPPPLHAQTPPPTERTFSPQNFHPAVGPDEFLSVEPARPLPHLNFSLGLWVNYANQPFVLRNVDSNTGTVGDTRARLINNLIGADLVFALGLFERLQIGIGIPATVYQDGEDFTYTYQGAPQTLKAPSLFALGDPWIDIKLRLFGRGEFGPQLALSALVTGPASLVTSDNYGGDPSLTAGGRILFGYEGARWRAGLSIGFQWRAHETTFFSTVIGSELRYAGAFAYDVVARRVTLVAEVFGHTSFSLSDASTISNVDASPVEAMLAAKLRVARPLLITVGAGTGIHSGTGAPVVRALLGLTYSPDRRDRDKDGISDADDKCIDTPEDKDNFEDADGCPEPDNDKDQFPDASDKCPNEAEDFDQFKDEDGCPEPDNDEDRIPDLRDACPLDKEDGKAPNATDGCPLEKTDTDQDGIADYKDKCPTDAEDKDGFQDDDGCPDPDNDQDGYPDKGDKCPIEAEDFDQFEDEDGCPDVDNDKDGLFDDKDKCPNEAENINGFQDEDGCPDKGPAPKVQLVGDEIIILDKVFFDTNKATIQPKSFNLLDQVAATVRAHRELKKVEVQGHTDNQGKKDRNKKLSQERAEAVKSYLVKKGVEPERLVPVGYGDEKPVSDNRTSKGREANRRVQFLVTERDKPAGAQQ